MWNVTLSSQCGSRNLILHSHVVVNWQLSNQGIRWPVSLDRIAGSGVTHRGYAFFEVLPWQVTNFQLIAGSTPSRLLCNSYKFKFVWRKLYFSTWASPLALAKFIYYMVSYTHRMSFPAVILFVTYQEVEIPHSGSLLGQLSTWKL